MLARSALVCDERQLNEVAIAGLRVKQASPAKQIINQWYVNDCKSGSSLKSQPLTLAIFLYATHVVHVHTIIVTEQHTSKVA